MKRAATILLSVFSILNLPAQTLLLFEGDTVLRLTYAGGDEFNAGELDDSQWHNGTGGRRLILDQDVAFNTQFVSFDDGNIVFKSDRSDSVYVCSVYEMDTATFKRKGFSIEDRKFKVKYEAGGVRSKRKYHYGIYELRFKTEDTKGVWPAFWFYGGKANEEIDAFELKGERGDEVHVDTHCPAGCDHGYKNKLGLPASYGGWMKLSESLSAGYSVMHLIWRENEILWLVNGKPLSYFKGTFSNPMYLFLNTQVSRTGGAFGPGPDSTSTFPNRFYIDYFRCWTFQDTVQKVSRGARRRQGLTHSKKFNDAFSLTPRVKRGLMYNRNKFNASKGVVTVYREGEKIMASVRGFDYEKEVVTISNKAVSDEVLITKDGYYAFTVEEQRTLVITLHQKKKNVVAEVTY
jgi:beta-glucanase (GH16 family)